MEIDIRGGIAPLVSLLIFRLRWPEERRCGVRAFFICYSVRDRPGCAVQDAGEEKDLSGSRWAHGRNATTDDRA